MPLDYICMDIDYMDRYIDFTVNKKRFPDLKAIRCRMKGKGVRLVPIVDAGIKVEKPGNSVYDEGVQKGYFLQKYRGKGLLRRRLPGMTHFPRFSSPRSARLVRQAVQGVYPTRAIEGFWNDMNEPAIFYSEYTKGKGGERKRRGSSIPRQTPSSAITAILPQYRGEEVNHWEVHNIFGAI